MNPGEKFEKDAVVYLKSSYERERTEFRYEGGMNSTKSDIEVFINGKSEFYIEIKDANAQSGQFVLLPDEEKHCFYFSQRNKSTPNAMTEIMTEYMNSDFERFNNAGTAGERLEIDKTVFAEWIIGHYKSKNVKFVISYGKDGFVIFPIEKYADYFDINANYRIKKSGSGHPAKRDREKVENEIRIIYPSAEFSYSNDKMFVKLNAGLGCDRIPLGKYTYFIAPRDNGKYEITRLSNTYNMTLIFSIKLIKEQDSEDLAVFESMIK